MFTLVIPVYGVQAYLKECLDSVLGQDFTDVQVVAVDDCSPDRCGEILDEYAAIEPRLTVLHLTENRGLGGARNAGLEHATGRYILFLDSDDMMTAGSLQAIAAEVERLEFPEMVIIDHARTYWWGKVARNLRHRSMASLAGSTFTLDEHPEILDFLQVAWNKVCRRDFLDREQLAFPDGYYEDTAWTHEAYFTARSIATLPEVCVLYRQRRHGSILGSTSRKHFDALGQWERVLAFLDQRPELAHWHDTVVRRMQQHFYTILTHPARLPPEDRSEFLRAASRQLRRFATARPAVNGRSSDDLFHTLIWIGDLHLFDSVSRAIETRRSLLRVVKRVQRRGRRYAKKATNATNKYRYHAHIRQPLDPQLAVFASLWNRGYAGNPAAIYEALADLAPEIHGVWVVNADRVHSFPDGIDYVTPGSARYWEVMARATYFVNDVNFPDDIVKRPGQVHVQTQHGTPLKHMGLDLMPHPAASKGMVFRKLLERSDRWDWNLSANRFSTLVWERAFPSPFKTLESGYPRNDALLRADADGIAAIRTQLGIPAGKTAILFAPTHRDHDKHFIIRADLRRLAESLGDDFVLMVRAHYFYRWMPELDQLEKEGLILNVSRRRDVEELMLAADALVTDYSSIMFDYANLDRPIVVYAPDWETYCDIRGVYFDIFETSPGLTLRTQDEVAKAFVTGEADGPDARAARASFRSLFCEFDDGRAAERVVRRVMLDEPVLPVVPLHQRILPPCPRTVSYELPSSEPVEYRSPDSPEAEIERALVAALDPVSTGVEDAAGEADPELDASEVTSHA